ncbi:unnamed protein product [Adineta ricciae]|uniref:Uncharacterized protein n=1 Tax=Adineta ricciae TaxID=249248 RepID=A0A815C6W3_ADIRI|nr:unnamed protein product [Adineta ricciae]
MKSVLCLLLALAVAHAAVLPFKPNCMTVLCASNAVCADGTPAPTPAWSCCPTVLACKDLLSIFEPILNCANVMCTMDVKVCPDGSRAPIPVGECCPSLSACKIH